MGPVPALMGTVPLCPTLATVGELVDLGDFPVSVRPYHSKPVSAKCVPTRDGFPTLKPASQRVDRNGTRGDGMFYCFTREELALFAHVRGWFDMAAACTCTHGTPDSCVPHGEVRPT